MPELPEVETVARDLRAAGLEGLRIRGARVYWPRTIAGLTVRAFQRRVKGATIRAIGRRAKFLVFDLGDAGTLLVHLRMSGRVHLRDPGTAREVHEHVVLSLADGRELRYHDTRKFGRWYLLADPEEKLGGLGPEPLEPSFTRRRFEACIAGRRRMLKPMLLDQTIVAGLGNIYVDEALFAAGLHPCRSADSLAADEIARLHRAIRKVLRIGVRSLGTSLGEGRSNFYSVAGRRGRNQDRLQVFRRTGEPCPRCNQAVERIIVGQRSTHICSRCQPLKVPK